MLKDALTQLSAASEDSGTLFIYGITVFWRHTDMHYICRLWAPDGHSQRHSWETLNKLKLDYTVHSILML